MKWTVIQKNKKVLTFWTTYVVVGHYNIVVKCTIFIIKQKCIMYDYFYGIASYKKDISLMKSTSVFNFLLFKISLKVSNLPLHLTRNCPQNQTAWDERATAINCSDTRKYMCLPNGNFTNLFEICYPYYSIRVSKGKKQKGLQYFA